MKYRPSPFNIVGVILIVNAIGALFDPETEWYTSMGAVATIIIAVIMGVIDYLIQKYIKKYVTILVIEVILLVILLSLYPD